MSSTPERVSRKPLNLSIWHGAAKATRALFVDIYADGSGQLLLGDDDPEDRGADVGRLTVDAERLQWLLALVSAPVATIPGIRLVVSS